MRLVDDQRVVPRQITVAGQFGEQDPVGHELDQRVLADLVGEPDLVADDVAELGAQLLGDPVGDGARGEPPRLGVADHAGDTAPQVQADLRDLRGLPGAGLARDDHDLVVADRGGDVVAASGDRKGGRVGDAGHADAADGHAGLGGVESGDDTGQRPGAVGVCARAEGGVEPAAQALGVEPAQRGDALSEFVDVDGGGGAAD